MGWPLALPAFWVGCCIRRESLNGLGSGEPLTAQERQALRDDVPRFGFKARIRDQHLFEIARECLKPSHAGLRRRGRIDQLGRDESRHLSRWSASSNGAARPRKRCWTNSTASGAVPWSPPIRNTRFNLTLRLFLGRSSTRTG